MPVNRNALIRYKTIDYCLRNRYRNWTLADLVEKCSEALYEYEGILKGVSIRTVQMDLQLMRSEKLGYNAPIIVVDKKYYTYEDPEYSITNIPLNGSDLDMLSEVVQILKEFKGFRHFEEMGGVINRLEDKIYTAKTHTHPIIDFEKNENLKGLEYLNTIYQAIQKKEVISIRYQSFKAREAGNILLNPYLLKEYRNRWFVLGAKKNDSTLINLALDRIIDIKVMPEESYMENTTIDFAERYKYVLGVTVNRSRPSPIHLWVNRAHAPYVLTKPIHPTQQLVANHKDGIEISILVIPNFELERELLGFGETIRVISPEFFKKRIASRLYQASVYYTEKRKENIATGTEPKVEHDPD